MVVGKFNFRYITTTKVSNKKVILTSYLFPIDWKISNIKIFRSSYHIITINDHLFQSTSGHFPVTAYHHRYLAIYFIGSSGVKVLNIFVSDAIKKILSRFWQGLKKYNYRVSWIKHLTLVFVNSKLRQQISKQIRKVCPLPLPDVYKTDLIFFMLE